MDKKENKRQCTVYPLRYRKDFRFYYFHKNAPISQPQSDVLLHVNGVPIQEYTKKIQSIAVVDCVWKKVEPALKLMENPLPPLVKIPGDFVTAYPRKSKYENLDPEGGLATIEAIFIAGAFLNNWDESLLSNYYFKKEFLKCNEQQWKKYKLGPFNND